MLFDHGRLAASSRLTLTTNSHNGSRYDVLVLLDSSGYIGTLNSVLATTGTVVSGDDVHRPIDSSNDKEYELAQYCREHLAGRFEIRDIRSRRGGS